MVVAGGAIVKGQTGLSMSMLALAVCAVEKYGKRVLILDVGFKKQGLEKYLVSNENRETDPFQTFGLDAMIRTGKFSGISKKIIEDAGYFFLDGKLLYIPPSRQSCMELYENEVEKYIWEIVKEAERHFDLIFIDGEGEQVWSDKNLGVSLVRLAGIPQNPVIIKEWFSKEQKYAVDFYLCGNYDVKSRYSMKNLLKLQGQLEKDTTGVVLRNEEWRDAMYDSSGIWYLASIYFQDKTRFSGSKYMEGKKRKKQQFAREVDRTLQKILKEGGVKL